MAKIIQPINLEVAKPNIFQALVAKQNDCNSRFLQVTLVHNGEKIEIDPTSIVTINADRNDGQSKSFVGIVNGDGTATVPLTAWMLGISGTLYCDVSILDENGSKLTSTKFTVMVEEASCSDEDVSKDEDYDILTQLIQEVTELKQDLPEDGFSPTIKVTTIAGGYRLAITDVNGSKTVDIKHGRDGKDCTEVTTVDFVPLYDVMYGDETDLQNKNLVAIMPTENDIGSYNCITVVVSGYESNERWTITFTQDGLDFSDEMQYFPPFSVGCQAGDVVVLNRHLDMHETDAVYLENVEMNVTAKGLFDGVANTSVVAKMVSGGGTGTGEDGKDGFSPIATVGQTADGAVITITDKNGTTSATVKNGSKGDTYTLTAEDKAEIAAMSGEVIPPAYWQDELNTKADAIQSAMEKAGRNKSAFLWYTDAHWSLNSKKSPVLLKYLVKNTPMNKVNFGGDIIGDPNPHNHINTKYAYEWREQISDLPNHHSVYGNHDVYHRAANVNNIAYAQLLAPEESTDMVVGGESYYYIDNPSEKTRYLYLAYITAGAGFSDSDTAAEMVAQGKFITSAIASVEEGWHIIVIAHRWYQYTKDANNQLVIEGGSFPFYEAEILRVFDAYNARATAHTSPNYIVPVDFTNAKGKVEFCIGGHCHLDYDFTTEGGIPVIITASDANQERNTNETEDNGTTGTITESAIFGIIADYTDVANTKITVVGVGRGTSRVIGDNVEPDEPVTTNLFNKDDPDVQIGYRINSSHNPVWCADGQLLTGYIEAKLNDVIIVSSDTANNKNNYTGSIDMYDANKTWLGMYNWAFTHNDTVVCSTDYKTVTFNIWDTYPGAEDVKAPIANTVFIRVTVAYTDIDSIVITKA